MPGKYRKPHRFKKRKPIYKNRFFWLFFAALFFLFFIFYFVFLTDFFSVKKINLAGQKEIREEELILLVKKETESKFLFSPGKNIFLVSPNKIKGAILENFPKIDQVLVLRRFPGELKITVSERKVKAIFCSMQEEEEKCFSLDKEGVVFEEKEKESDSLTIIKIPLPEKKIILGEKIMEEEEISSILKINFELKETLQIPIKEFIVDSPDKLTALAKENWPLYFSLQEDIEWQLKKLKAIKEDDKIPEKERKNLEYIELRFGNFVNIKYKEKQTYSEIEIDSVNQNDI